MATGAVFELDIDGVKEMLTGFSRFEEHIDDMREPFGEVADHLNTVIGRRFDVGGPGWAGLKPSYAAWKAAHYPGRQILTRTGAMRGSVGNVRRITAHSLEWGLDTPYAIFHQRGAPRANVPQRRIVHLEPDDTRNIHRIMLRYLVRKARQAGLKTSG